MARTRVFVSSTHYDLKYVRAAIGGFLQTLGFDVTMSEKALIPYDHTKHLDESCYAEVDNADILVLIIGARAGSPASSEPQHTSPSKQTPRERFYTQYESITKKEYERAHAKGMPVYAFIEAAVYYEYKTFKSNRESTEIDYTSVENVNVFRLLDSIYSKELNNAVEHFEDIGKVEGFLREQFSGLFREMLRQRGQSREFSTLRDRIEELKEISNSTLELVKVGLFEEESSEQSQKAVVDKQQQEKDAHERALNVVREDKYCQNLIRRVNLSQREFTSALTSAKTLDEFIAEIGSRTVGMSSVDAARSYLARYENLSGINRVRKVLGLPEFVLTDSVAIFHMPHDQEVVFSGIAANVASTIDQFCLRKGLGIEWASMDEELKDWLRKSNIASAFLSEQKLFDAAENVLKKIHNAASEPPA